MAVEERPSVPQWEAEVPIDADHARRAIARAFPDLATLPVRALGEGWDNAAFLVGERYVFRFPRRAIAAELLETEMRVLPVIAPQLPLPVPIPRFISAYDCVTSSEADPSGVTSSEADPSGVTSSGAKRSRDAKDEHAINPQWPYAGYEILPGRAVSSVRLNDGEYERVAADIGRFLRTLHGIPRETVPGLGGDRIGRLDHARCMPKAMQRLRTLQDAGVIENMTAFEEVLERNARSTTGPRRMVLDDVHCVSRRAERSAVAASAGNGAIVVVHGDLYGRHILVDTNARACGIIDWGDIHAGDPAVDLAAAFEVFPASARGAFFEAYGDVDERTRSLARYRGLYHSAMVAHYGWSIGDQELLRAGLAGLSSCLV